MANSLCPKQWRFSFTPNFHAPIKLASTIERPGQSASTATLAFLDTIEVEKSLSIHKNELGTLLQHTLSKQLDA